MLLANALDQNHPPSIACFISGGPRCMPKGVPPRWPAAVRLPAGCRPAAGRLVAGRLVRFAGRCRPVGGAGAGRPRENKNVLLLLLELLLPLLLCCCYYYYYYCYYCHHRIQYSRVKPTCEMVKLFKFKLTFLGIFGGVPFFSPRTQSRLMIDKAHLRRLWVAPERRFHTTFHFSTSTNQMRQDSVLLAFGSYPMNLWECWLTDCCMAFCGLLFCFVLHCHTNPWGDTMLSSLEVTQCYPLFLHFPIAYEPIFPSNAFMASARSSNTFNCMLQNRIS